MKAAVMRWVPERGYGFAQMPGGTELIFVHQTMIVGQGAPTVGDVLEIDGVEEGARGWRATGYVALVRPTAPDADGEETDYGN